MHAIRRSPAANSTPKFGLGDLAVSQPSCSLLVALRLDTERMLQLNDNDDDDHGRGSNAVNHDLVIPRKCTGTIDINLVNFGIDQLVRRQKRLHESNPSGLRRLSHFAPARGPSSSEVSNNSLKSMLLPFLTIHLANTAENVRPNPTLKPHKARFCKGEWAELECDWPNDRQVKAYEPIGQWYGSNTNTQSEEQQL
ncbi:hypothetical protein CSKR_114040 [Clonorchis sinensis]|uniref:Uncharacterized protein n=1 Tax=Clonorchis sinensis TaxID=79923 RepID=A0A419PWB1_CLOSI|nr:hypothetical protein CSKR_114040 [Clonorchis sinensis]